MGFDFLWLSVAVTEMLNKSKSLFEHMFIFCSLACFFLRARWLKESTPEAEQLFIMVSEVFIFWAKSHVNMTVSIFSPFINFQDFSCKYLIVLLIN